MEWRPRDVLACISGTLEQEDAALKSVTFAILLLNQPIQNELVFMSLWNKASLRVIADGGGNHWDYLDKKFPNTLKHPHIVSGDFDSIRPEVLNYFKKEKDIDVILTEDQDESDCTKSLRILGDRISRTGLEIIKILVYCEISGRFDQIMANVETLHHALTFLSGKQVFLMSSSSMSWLLPPGSQRIFICGKENNSENSFRIPYCSLIPVGSPCKVTTSGLKWDLKDDTLAFGRLVSTSNEIDKDANSIFVETSHPLLWSMEITYNTIEDAITFPKSFEIGT